MIELCSFLELYRDVFDSEGNVKLCGREKCMDLIEACNSLKGGNYGNLETGVMNIDKIKELYVSIHSLKN